MKTRSRLCGLIILACGVMGLALLSGCSDANTLLAEPTSDAIEVRIPDPIAPSADNLTDPGIIKPLDQEAVALLSPIDLLGENGVVTAGADTSFAVNYGDGTAAVAGLLPLTQQGSGLATGKQALLPAGDSVIEMIGSGLGFTNTAAQRAGAQPIVVGLRIRHSVTKGWPPTWTLPSKWRTTFTRSGKNTYIAKDSFLHLEWNGKGAVPPQDSIIVSTVSAYHKGAHVWTSTHTDDPVHWVGSGGWTKIVGHNQMPFDAISVTIDLRHNKN